MTFERAVIDLEKLAPHGIEMWLHSIRRYQFVASYLKNTDWVLDICCGTGYGAAIMAKDAGYVLGIDRNTEAIIFAKEKYPNCNFKAQDILEFKFEHKFKVITMFECLDHLGKSDGLHLLEKVSGHCNDMVILSLPQDQKFDTNKYHLAEWTDKELKAVLEKYFKRVILFGQSWSTGQIFFPYDERRSMTIFIGSK